MSEEQQDEFLDHLKRLDFLANWLRYLIIGTFALGCWVTTIQMNVTANTQGGITREARIRELELQSMVIGERTASVFSLLQRIEHKLDAIEERQSHNNNNQPNTKQQ